MTRSIRAILNPSLAWAAVRLASPVVAAYVALASVMAFELWAIGQRLGAEAVAGVGLGSWLFIVFFMGFHSLEIGCQTIVARRFGEKRWTQVGAVVDNALAIGLVLGLVLTAVLWVLGPLLLRTPDPLVHETAVEYFRLRVLGLTPLLVTLALIGFYNGIGRPHMALYGYVASTVSHALLIYLLVLGGFGVEPMGARGAALASVFAIGLGTLFMALPLVGRRLRKPFALFRLRHLSLEVLRSLGRLATPILVQNVTVHAAVFVFLRINASIGTVALAATNIALAVGNFSYLPAVGFGVAAATLVSRALGARNPSRAAISATVCSAFAIVFMGTMGLVFFFGGGWIVAFFLDRGAEASATGEAVREEVVRTGAVILRILGALQVFDALGTVFSKALQGAGLTKYVMWVEMVLYYVVLLPLAWLFGRVLGWGAVGTWAAFGVFLVGYGLTLSLKFRRGDWKTSRV